jgi:predicted dehydrogenase
VEAAVNSAAKLRVGVVGTGALGRHHARILSQLADVEMVGIYDRRPEAAEAVASEHGVRAWSSYEELASRLDAAVVAAPTVAHAELGCDLLGRGVHVLVEKPIASSIAEADALLAAQGDRVLAVGHVEFFNPAVQALRGALGGGAPPRFLEVQRLAVFTPRSLDVDVVLDLMIHDIQILHALDPSPLHEVRATGIAVLSRKVDIANARIALASGCVANLTASRVSAERVRKLRAFLPSRYYSLDYQQQEIKGYRLEAGADGARSILPDDLAVLRGEPLRHELEAFLAACRGERGPLVDGTQGRNALATALAVGEAIRASTIESA